MQPLIQYLADRAGTPPDVTLVIGAGNGAALSSLRRLQSKRLILVEAHPEQAEAIARRIDTTRNEEVWQFAATTSSAAEATLQVLNNPLYSSLKVPGDLLKHLPNLRVTSEIVVAARALDEVIEGLHLDDGDNNLLVLDAPGQVLNLITETSPKNLQSFSTIIVSCGVEPLYSGDGSREEGVAALRALGFDVALDDDDAIYPTCAFLLRRDDARVQLQNLKEEIRELRAAHASQAEQHKLQVEATLKAHAEALTQARQQAAIELRKPAEDFQAQLNKLARERDEQAEAAAHYRTAADQASQAAAEQQKLAEDRQTQIHRLMQERDEQAESAAQHKTAADQASQAAAEQQKLAEDRQAQIQKLTHERGEQAKSAAQHKTAADQASQAAAEQQKLAEDRQAQIQKLTQERDEQQKLATNYQTQSQQMASERNRAVEELTDRKKELGNLEAQLSKAQDELAKLIKSDVALKQELAETRRTLSLSVRLQTLREEDLKELQGRYAVLLQKQTSQQQLLAKLSERLAAAAGYFHQLTSSNGETALDHGNASRKEDAGESASKGKVAKRIEQDP
jgi:hypothetical protein